MKKLHLYTIFILMFLSFSCNKAVDEQNNPDVAEVLYQSIIEMDGIYTRTSFGPKRETLFNDLLIQGIYNGYEESSAGFNFWFPTKIDFLDSTHTFVPISSNIRQALEERIKNIEWMEDYDVFYSKAKNKNKWSIAFTYPLILEDEAIVYCSLGREKILFGGFVFFFKKINGKWVLEYSRQNAIQ